MKDNSTFNTSKKVIKNWCQDWCQAPKMDNFHWIVRMGGTMIGNGSYYVAKSLGDKILARVG